MDRRSYIVCINYLSTFNFTFIDLYNVDTKRYYNADDTKLSTYFNFSSQYKYLTKVRCKKDGSMIKQKELIFDNLDNCKRAIVERLIPIHLFDKYINS